MHRAPRFVRGWLLSAFAALLGAVIGAGSVAGQVLTVDSVLPKPNTVYGDLDPNTPGVQFVWCIADTYTPLDTANTYTQTGYLHWLGELPDNTGYPYYVEAPVDSASASTRPSQCSTYQVGNTSTLGKGMYNLHAIAQVREQAATPVVTADTVAIDSVYLYPSPAHIAFGNYWDGQADPRDTIYTAISAPSIDVMTDLGEGQAIEVYGYYTPFGAPAPTSSIFPWTAYTDSTGWAPVYGEFGFYDGDGIYTVIAKSDSVPGTFAPATDTMTYILTSSGLNMQVLQPDSGGVYPTSFEVYGKVAPGSTLRLSCACAQSGDTTVSARDSTWTFGTVQFDTAGVTVYYSDPAASFAGGYVQVPFTFSSNLPPTATITEPSKDTTVIVGDTVTFSGTGTDPDGTVAGYLWDLGGGNEVSGQTVQYAFPAAGVDTVLFRVTDNNGATSSPDTVIMTVVPNQPPTATITRPSSDTTVFVGDAVTFSGTGSDPDGTVVGYLWDLGGGNEVSGQTVQYAFPAAGVDTVLLRVTDNKGATSAPDTVMVTVVANQPPTATITEPSKDTTVFAGDTVTFSGTGSDPDGTVVGYLWDLGGGNEAAGQTVRYAYPSAGVDTVLLRVTDDRGATSSADTVMVTVVANQPPTATITAPSKDTTVSGGDAVSFAGTGTDPDGSVVGYAWHFGDGGQATGSSTTHTFTNGGTFTVTLVVTDDRGATSAPDSVSVTVVTVNRPPSVAITEPAQDTTVTVGETIHLSATATDPDGDATTIRWQVGADTSRTGPTTSVVYTVAGTDTVRARATDANGATSDWAVRVLTVVGRGPNVDRTAPGSAQRVDGHDVVFVLEALTTQNPLADTNGDGVVDDTDVQAVLAAFGTIPQSPTQEPRR